MVEQNRKIACVGSGVIGRGWATGFARAGFEVSLYDISEGALQHAVTAIKCSLEDLEKAGLITSVEETIALIKPTLSLGDAVLDACYVQESVFEDIEVKREVYEALDQHIVADTVVGSSVSGLPATAFMGGLSISPRCLVMHPTTPPYLAPLTEIFCTPWTSDEALQFAEKLMAEVGQVTVRINKEVDGYVLNRIQAAVVGEALHLVGEGVITAADLDKVLVYGLAMRWSFMGPFLTGHLNAAGGYKDYMTRYGDCYKRWGKDLRVDYDWDMEVIDQVHASLEETFPFKGEIEGQRWRDSKLMELRKNMQDDH